MRLRGDKLKTGNGESDRKGRRGGAEGARGVFMYL